MSLLYIKLMSKHYGVLLSFPSIDFYNDSGWATLIQILKHMLKTFESWWSRLSSFMPTNVSGADSSLGLCLFVKRLNVVLRHMIISLNVFVQYPSAFLFLSLCCRNFNSRFHWFPMDRMQRACFDFFFVFFFTFFNFAIIL